MTPVQFDDTFEILNQINKLYISDEARLSLEAIQVCKNPVGKGHPIIGKFAKEDSQGSLCCQSVEKFTNVELVVGSNPGDITRYLTIEFSQQIYGLMAYPLGYNYSLYNLYWAIPDGEPIKFMWGLKWKYLPVVGKSITFWLNSLKSYQVACYGIYF